jgi:hypothetical protein
MMMMNSKISVDLDPSHLSTPSLERLRPQEQLEQYEPDDDDDVYLYKLQQGVTKSILYTLPYRPAKKAYLSVESSQSHD